MTKRKTRRSREGYLPDGRLDSDYCPPPDRKVSKAEQAYIDYVLATATSPDDQPERVPPPVDHKR